MATGFTLVELMVIVGVLGLLIAFAIPNYARARRESQRQLCVHNLTRIDQAKDQWALEQGQVGDAEPTEEDLIVYFDGQTLPRCPGGGEYSLGTIAEVPACTLGLEEHLLSAEEAEDPEEEGPPPRGQGRGKRRQK